MKQIMIMSHSIFAEGIKSACEDMLGPQNDIITIGFTNNAEFEKTNWIRFQKKMSLFYYLTV